MADNEDNDAPGPGGTSSGAGNAQSRAKVTWRGIVEEDEVGKPRKKRRVMGGVAGFFDSLLIAVGIRRSRNDDGTPGDRHLGRTLAIFGGALVLLLIVSAIHVVQAGTVGVPVTFGSAGSPMDEGLRITAPWPIAQVYGMSIQTQNYTMTAADVPGTDDPVLVLGRDGASGSVDATVLYRLDPARASDVYRDIGTDYSNKLVKPSARSCIRSEFANYDLVAASTENLPEVNEKVTQCMRDKIESRGINLQDFQLREVKLGDDLTAAVNAKAASQQKAESQKFERATAEQQAAITRTQAQATADAQQILACGGTTQTVNQDGLDVQVVVPNSNEACAAPRLTQEILQYSYIQALRELMKTPNANVVIIPSGGGAPLINIPTPSTGN